MKGETENYEYEERKVKALESIAKNLSNISAWLDEIDKDDWSERIQWYLDMVKKAYLDPALEKKQNMHKLGVIVPYRDREEHLKVFVPHLCEYLTNSGIGFEIIVVEQGDSKPFNRGSLLNLGFLKAEKL